MSGHPVIRAVIFDLGGVLIDWNPRYIYREVFDSEEKMEWFLAQICNMAWNEQQDGGYPIAKAVEEKLAQFPEWEKEIRLYYDRWIEMLKDPVPGTLALFHQLKKRSDLRLYALTNWSAELFPYALKKYHFLKEFDGIVVSGEEKMKKPDPEIFQLLLKRFRLDANDVVFIDDSLRNIHAAEELRIRSIHFKNPEELKKDLEEIGL
ncbi:MAG TPA: HAD family phosphatase [Chitinophagaceae bacterium]|nr:HAD family phosphatase [Chitinophagaceae bacterium]